MKKYFNAIATFVAILMSANLAPSIPQIHSFKLIKRRQSVWMNQWWK